jgi:hypothetical protein
MRLGRRRGRVFIVAGEDPVGDDGLSVCATDVVNNEGEGLGPTLYSFFRQFT